MYVINKRITKGHLFHYAHFICDCLFPEIVMGLCEDSIHPIFRIKNLDQTLGNFKHMYEDVTGKKSIELPEDEFYIASKASTLTKLVIKERLQTLHHMEAFRRFVFRRYSIDPTIPVKSCPDIVLIKRGDRIELIDDEELKKINTNVATGKERREIKDIERVEDYLKDKYTDRFLAVFLETLPFEEQVKLFCNANLLVMAHGAAMSNLFFCTW